MKKKKKEREVKGDEGIKRQDVDGVGGVVRLCLLFFFFDFFFCFFFQAEDGIRDRNVTGVQTCALPILVLMAPSFRAARPSPSQETTVPCGLSGGGYFHLIRPGKD